MQLQEHFQPNLSHTNYKQVVCRLCGVQIRVINLQLSQKKPGHYCNFDAWCTC